MNVALLIRLIVVTAILACGGRVLAGPESADHTVGDSHVPPTGVNIYLLEDESIDLETARAMPLSELVLRKEPWIVSDDIERYDLSSHYIYLKRRLPAPLKTVSLRGNPFVVTADGHRCYLGALWSHGSSFFPEHSVPLIYVSDFVPPDVVAIRHAFIITDRQKRPHDVRNDPRVVQTLVRGGLAHAGLSLTLDRVEVSIRGGGASVRYTYTLQNKDTDNLYVFDPDKMGADLFHWFNNPPSLLAREGDGVAVSRTGRTANPPTLGDKLDRRWFSRIKSGRSMTRTVTLDGYPTISPGEYVCSFRFHSPGPIATKDRRPLADGRIWMGEIDATLTVNVTQNKRDNGERSSNHD